MEMDSSTLWIVTGIALVIGEMLTTSFYLLFIALGCFAGALAASLGQAHLAQGIACAAVSIVGVAALRKPLHRRMVNSVKMDADVGKEVVSDQTIAPHQQARITYQGTSWLATNLSADPIRAGERVVIESVDGNVLLLRKIN